MLEVPLRTAGDWTRFLSRWSAEWIDVAARPDTPAHLRFADEVVDAGWLGSAPASDETIAAAEERLGVRLPPSYRQFLTVSDGWGPTSPFIHDLLPAAGVGWFRDLNTEWLEIWADINDEGMDDEDDPDDDEDEYEGELSYDVKVMSRGLQICNRGDSAVLLLDPEDVGPDGEWASYFFSNWGPGLGERRPSFAALMQAEHASFVHLEKPAGETLRELAELTEQARRLLLDGRLDEGLPPLAQAREYGVPAALLLDAQARLLLGDQSQAQANLGLVLPHQHPELAEDAFVAQEIVPLLLSDPGSEYHLTNYRTQNSDALASLLNARPGEPVTFADPAFDLVATRARDLAAAGDTDGAWAAILEGLPAWQATGPYALAPIGLLADPILAPLLTHGRGEALLRTARDRHPS